MSPLKSDEIRKQTRIVFFFPFERCSLGAAAGQRFHRSQLYSHAGSPSGPFRVPASPGETVVHTAASQRDGPMSNSEPCQSLSVWKAACYPCACVGSIWEERLCEAVQRHTCWNNLDIPVSVTELNNKRLTDHSWFNVLHWSLSPFIKVDFAAIITCGELSFKYELSHKETVDGFCT